MMNMQDVLNKVDEWKATQTAMRERRLYWTTHTKQLLLDTLDNIRKASGLDMQVQNVNPGANQQAVNISFNKSSSGMHYHEQTSHGVKMKFGGTLIFAQAYNGDVFVLITFPSIEDHMTEQPAKMVERKAPQDIDAAYIMKQFVNFLNEMTKWEKAEGSYSTIGFKVGQQAAELSN